MWKLLVIVSRPDSVHQIVVEFPTTDEADKAFENLVEAKGALHVSLNVIKLY